MLRGVRGLRVREVRGVRGVRGVGGVIVVIGVIGMRARVLGGVFIDQPLDGWVEGGRGGEAPVVSTGHSCCKFTDSKFSHPIKYATKARHNHEK